MADNRAATDALDADGEPVAEPFERGLAFRLGPLDWVAFVLLIVGGSNWGSVALAERDFIVTVFGAASITGRLICLLIGVAALYMIGFCARSRDRSVRRQAGSRGGIGARERQSKK